MKLETIEELKQEINSYEMVALLKACYNYFDIEIEKPKALWVPLTIMKWTYLYGTRTKPVKPLTVTAFRTLFDAIMEFDPDHISNYMKSQGIHRAFAILHYQQFYLQTAVHKERFSTQLKLYENLKSRYDISASFKKKTGLSITEFLRILQCMWLYAQMKQSEFPNTKITGYVSQPILDSMSDIFGKIQTERFINLLMITPLTAAKEAKKWKGTNATKYEIMEHSFLTLFPFQWFENSVRIVHPSVFNYTANYYIYDYMKINDPKFTTEFGARFEKYIQLGLDEININYKIESEVKRSLSAKHKVVDFLIDDNILLECKAIEPKPLASINPTDDYVYSSYKDSLLKAYYDQMLPVSKFLNPNQENWGIVITHKNIFWSDYRELYQITKDRYANSTDNSQLPPENVFIMDIHTWDLVINVIATGQTTLPDLLKKARNANANHLTRKAQFDMQLDDFDLRQFQLSYLAKETELLKL
ncbi:hypothetical protein [Lacinutrix chionoecetis]